MNAPAHVAPERIYDFDIYHDASFGSELHTSLDDLHRLAPDIFYTLRNGGHWVVTRFTDIESIVQNPDVFSVREMQIPRVPEPPVFLPLSLDPPENVPYRQALMPRFSPKAVKELEEKIRHWAVRIVSEVADRGQCDFIYDVSELYPVSIFMELMGMDLSRLREMRQLAESFFHSFGDTEAFTAYSAKIIETMTEYIELKRSQPDEGLISYLVNDARVNGRPMRLDELQNMCFLLFNGGMHTVTNATGFIFWQLAKSPALQQKLSDQPALISALVDEGLRMFGVVNTPRIVRKDCEQFGVTFRAGDMVLCMLPLAGRDDRVNPNPYEIDLERAPGNYLTFSRGAHLCVGHFLARTEMRILTEEWLRRIPRFSLVPDSRQVYSAGTTMGLSSLPLQWEAPSEVSS